ncbi:MAG: sulfatase, partial [Armatimonadetes bacterium]|nr:sulfatase [Armatimonadota bacterium]
MTITNRRTILAGMGALAGLSLTPSLSAEPAPRPNASRPNFVFFLTDDQRWDALSLNGNRILRTPNIDRIGREGIRFQNMFVTNALCAPSRASFLTGLYSHAHGVVDNGNRQIPKNLPLISDYLRQAGYEAAFCGKSHVAGALRDRQWDYYFGYRGQGNYLQPVIAEGVNGPDRRYDGYMDDVVTDHAVNWLKAKREKPFVLFVWFKAPHRSWMRARRHHDLFRDAAVPMPDTYDADLKGYPGKPRAFAEADNKIGDFQDVRSLEFVKDYYATLTAVDENVGRVLDALQETRKLDDTAVIYSSDNGFFHGEWRMFDKRFMHEPSIRVPLLIRYPRRIPPNTRTEKMALNVDLAPTMLELAGVPVPAGMHGRSLAPLLDGKPSLWRADWLYEYYEFPAGHRVRRHRGVRTVRH